jgi:hypothetical protein
MFTLRVFLADRWYASGNFRSISGNRTAERGGDAAVPSLDSPLPRCLNGRQNDLAEGELS